RTRSLRTHGVGADRNPRARTCDARITRCRWLTWYSPDTYGEVFLYNHLKLPITSAQQADVEFHRTKVPFFRQIYEAYRSAILSGTLRPGQRLPSTRALSAQLGISRLPVLNAFDQLLHEGFIVGKVGSGTFVKGEIPGDLSPRRPAPPPQRQR